MKAFYDALQESEKSTDNQIEKLAAVCNADLEGIQQDQIFEQWEWWF